MNDVRDEALGALLDGAAIGMESVPGDRLSEVLRRGSWRRAARLTAICSAVAMFVGAVSWAGMTLPNEEGVIPADISDWRTFGSLQEDGWTLQAPPSWRIQETGRCQGPRFQFLGAVVTSVDFEFRNRRGALADCWDAYVWAGFPRDGVAFAVQPYSPFGIVNRGPVTHFPLTPEALAQSGAVRGGPTESYVIVRVPGEDYPLAIVRRWVGPEASAADVAALDRMLGSLQVRSGDRWTETDGGLTTLHDEKDNYVVTYPTDWIVAGENLTPQLSEPVEILSLGTFPLRTGRDIDDGLRVFDAPVAPKALEDMTSTDAFLSLQETGAGVGGFDARPDHFGPLGCDESIYGCRPPEELSETSLDAPFRAWWIPFEDAGRGFYLFVAIGYEATPQLRDQAWAVADSLSFDPDLS